MRLERMLRPKSIAVIGGHWAANVVQQCKLMGFAGDIWPVHPRNDEVHGIRAYRLIEDLPGSPDAAFAEGTLLGKRYVDADDSVELLCVKAGAGSLSVNGVALTTKDATPLPSSD